MTNVSRNEGCKCTDCACEPCICAEHKEGASQCECQSGCQCGCQKK